MKQKKERKGAAKSVSRTTSAPERIRQGRIFSLPDQDKYLDMIQLDRLEQSFRIWSGDTPRPDMQLARRRILIVFLLIRYTGAKLNEVLSLDPFHDIDFENRQVFFGRSDGDADRPRRKVQISETLCNEIRSAVEEPAFKKALRRGFQVDPGFVRRKFYERAVACEIPKQLGAPEMIRKSRAVELMQGNMPLSAVQKLLGHSTPNLTSSYVSVSDDEIQQITRFFMEKESSRKTSARNSFFGKIQKIVRGDIQARVELFTIAGYPVVTIITIESLERLGLKPGQSITAEVKAPWVILYKRDREPECSAENRFQGTVTKIHPGSINTEFIVRITDGTELCSVVTTESARRLDIREKDPVWVLFNAYSVVLQMD